MEWYKFGIPNIFTQFLKIVSEPICLNIFQTGRRRTARHEDSMKIYIYNNKFYFMSSAHTCSIYNL